MDAPIGVSAALGDEVVATSTPPDSLKEETHVEGAFTAGLAARYSVANLGASVVYGLFNLGMPLYLESYGLHPSLIGLLANERSFVGAFVQPIVGRLSDRTRTPLGRRRPFFLIGVPLMSLSLILLAFHPDFWLMLLLMTIGSFFLAVAMDPYNALMADLFPPQHRGRVGGFIGMTTALGIITFALIANFLWEDSELLVFAIVIGILIATFAFTFFTVRERPAPAHVEVAKGERPGPLAYFSELLRYREAAKYTLALGLYWIGAGGATPFVTLFGKKALGLTDSEVFLLPLAFVVSTAIFAVPFGMLADRIGKKRVITVGLLVYGIGAIVGSQSANLTQAAIALGIIGIGNAATSAPLIALLVDLIPRKRTAELLGLGSAMWSLAQPLGSVLAGGVVGVMGIFIGESGSYRWSFIFAGVMIVLAAIILQSVKPERRAAEEY
ncbi:MAG TPA: MFS transporter [Chloroflexia bacterium]|nr:MFS transporter [Chloroflexia bacterium]